MSHKRRRKRNEIRKFEEVIEEYYRDNVKGNWKKNNYNKMKIQNTLTNVYDITLTTNTKKRNRIQNTIHKRQ